MKCDHCRSDADVTVERRDIIVGVCNDHMKSVLRNFEAGVSQRELHREFTIVEA